MTRDDIPAILDFFGSVFAGAMTFHTMIGWWLIQTLILPPSLGAMAGLTVGIITACWLVLDSLQPDI